MGVKDDFPHQMSVRITDKMRDTFFEAAKFQDLTMTQLLRQIMQKEITRYKRLKHANKN